MPAKILLAYARKHGITLEEAERRWRKLAEEKGYAIATAAFKGKRRKTWKPKSY